MRLRLPHATYVSNKIAIDILNSGFVEISQTLDQIKKIAQTHLEQDIKKEMALESKVSELLEENSDEIEFMRLDQRQLFWMAKKKLAEEYQVILSLEDRYNNLAHTIMNALVDEGVIYFEVSDNKVKNIIFRAIDSYLKGFEEIEDLVLERIDNYKRKLIPGTEEYELVFQKLYEDELKKKGLL